MTAAKDDRKMTLTQHLGELKKCIVIIVVIFALAFIGCYVFSSDFIQVIVNIDPSYQFVQSDVTEILAQQIKVSMIVAIVIDSPVIVWQLNRFVSPGLTKSEGRKFLWVMIGGLMLFAVGTVFCYFIVIPFTLKFFKGLNTIDAVASLINLKSYISYIVAMLLAFGCIFEMPVVAAVLSAIGLLKPKAMVAARRYVIVVFFILGAAITPPDVMSQCMVAIPMILLYELSIGICKIIYSSRRRKMIAEGIDPDEAEEEAKAEKAKQSRWAMAKAQVEMADARKKTNK